MTDLSTDLDTAPHPGRGARRWLMSAAVVALLAGIIAHVVANPDEIAHFRKLSLPILVATVLSQFLVQVFMNGALLVPLQRHVARLGFWEFFMVRTGGLVAAFMVPVAGGIAVRLAYLRRRGLTYADFTWATIVSNVLALVAAAALAVVATGVLWAVAGPPPLLVVTLMAGMLAAGVAAMLVLHALPRLAGHPRLSRWSWLAAMRGFSLDTPTAGGVFGYSLLRHLFNFLTFGLLYGGLSRSSTDFLTGGLVYALTSPIRMVNLTPGNLGVNEWVVAIVGKALAFDVTTGLIVALVFRGVTLVAQGLGAVVAWGWMAAHDEA